MAPQHPHRPQVSVVVIGYDDAGHLMDAVRSALEQGPAVHEVIAVDDGSTDGSGALLDRLAAGDPRLTVVHRRVNSGGCGTPRNDGLDTATAPYVMFLDSDDVLPSGAVDALLTAAARHGAQVAAGLCVRRELPSGREVPWQPRLYEHPAVIARPARRPRLVHDTLCVNKLYCTAFLREHTIRFPEGRFPYEDFVFTARVLAAAPRMVLVPDPVYIWHVRRTAGRPSLSLDRARPANWHARVEANRQVHEILLGAGEKRLARAARTKFLDHGLRMYARELEQRDPAYVAAWWTITREFLAGFDAGDLAAAPAPGRVTAQVVLASETPRDLPRLRELAARPARLCPPYPRAADGTPIWSADLPQVTLEHLLVRPVRVLPAAVDAKLRPRARGAQLRLRLHELYGRMAQARPLSVDIEFTGRVDGRTGLRRTVAWSGAAGSWVAETSIDLSSLASGTWDLRLRLRFADGTAREATAHAAGTRRTAVPSRRHGILLVQPYATHSGSLAVRLAPGLRGAAGVLRRRLFRLLH